MTYELKKFGISEKYKQVESIIKINSASKVKTLEAHIQLNELFSDPIQDLLF